MKNSEFYEHELNISDSRIKYLDIFYRKSKNVK